MIKFSDVSKKYDNGTTALKNVNIQIDKGEFVFVVGSSGAGKSTFLKLMMREEVPSHGTISVDGVILNAIKKRQIPYFRRKLGIVFQDFRLIPTMTVFDNVAFAMRVIGAKEKKIRKRVPYVLALVGLQQKARSMPNELSGGEQQRVALARALVNNADVIIADEPTGNVDPQMSYEIVDLLMKLNENGTTVIMVTHDHELVRRFDRRVIILEKGEVVSDGGPLISDIATAHINAVSEITQIPAVAVNEEAFASGMTVEIMAPVSEAQPEEAPAEAVPAVEEAPVEAVTAAENAQTVESAPEAQTEIPAPEAEAVESETVKSSETAEPTDTDEAPVPDVSQEAQGGESL